MLISLSYHAIAGDAGLVSLGTESDVEIGCPREQLCVREESEIRHREKPSFNTVSSDPQWEMGCCLHGAQGARTSFLTFNRY